MLLHTHATRTLAFFLAVLIFVASALPASVLEDIMSNGNTNKKVKRAHVAIEKEKPLQLQKELYFPTAVKRSDGNRFKGSHLPLLTEWDQQRYREQHERFPLYAQFDEMEESYPLGHRNNGNEEDASLLNQYRYNGNDERRRKRRNAKLAKRAARVQEARSIRYRLKRNADLSPEQILAILSVWENERLLGQQERPWGGYDESDAEAEEDWLDAPVRPHAADDAANYYYDVAPPAAWSGFNEHQRPHKRFMIAKKRIDPTRELRYFAGAGPNARNDYYTLNELIAANQRDLDVPLYQRYIL